MIGQAAGGGRAGRRDDRVAGNSGGDLALIHGWGIGSACWGAAADALAATLGAGWRIHRVSLPGYDNNPDLNPGHSPDNTRNSNADGNTDADNNFAACADALLARLPAGVILCGWSLGGLLALQAAANAAPQVGGLILVGSTPCFTQRHDWNAAQSPAVLAAFRAALADDAAATRKRFLALLNQGDSQARALTRTLSAALLASAEPSPAALARGLDWLRDVDLRHRLPEIAVPTLIIHGESDTLTPPDAGRHLAAGLPNAQFVSFAAAHAPFLADAPGFAESVAAFLATLPAAGGVTNGRGAAAAAAAAPGAPAATARNEAREDASEEAREATQTCAPTATQAAAVPPALPAKQRVRAAFDRAASSYDAAAVVQRRVADLLAAGLAAPCASRDAAAASAAGAADAPSTSSTTATATTATTTPRSATSAAAAVPHSPPPAPRRVIDAGCGTGYGGSLLRARWPGIELLAADFAPAMLAHPTHANGGALRVAADIEALPCADASVDLYWSSLAIQWCDSARFAREAARCLRADGRLAVSTLGPDTFSELRAAFAGVDRYRHTLAFAPPQALADELHAAGFSDIRIERQTLTLHYPGLRELLAAVREIGANGVGAGARRGLMSRSVWQAFTAGYERQRQAQGLPASYDVILAYARKPAGA